MRRLAPEVLARLQPALDYYGRIGRKAAETRAEEATRAKGPTK